MARGKSKQRKDERSTSKLTIPSLTANHHDVKHLSLPSVRAEQACTHRNLDSRNMKSVASLLSKLFTTSFQLALPSLFRGMIQNLQDHVLKEKIFGFLDAGFSPSLIRSMARDQSTRQGITAQIRMACEEELADVALRISTEDCFDLACNLAHRHGRDLDEMGPPCACSFSHCLGCLEKEVTTACSAASMPAPPIQSVDREKLEHMLLDLLESEDSLACELWQLGAAKKNRKWIIEIGDAWQDMADTMWKIAEGIEPMKLPQVTEALDALCKVDGLDLWYMICMREFEATSDATKEGKNKRANGVLASSMNGEFEKMKRQNDKLKKLRLTDSRDRDEYGTAPRKALARAIREQGNALFAKGLYEEASNMYTRAIGYDDEEAVFPLNRAACLVKLSRFKEAEADCTRALELDSTNHKAFFRRGASRAGLGDVNGAARDFTEVLHLQKDDASNFLELRKLSIQFLQQASKKKSKVSHTNVQIELLLPTLPEVSKVVEIETDEEEEEEEDLYTTNEEDNGSNGQFTSEDEASIDVRNVVDDTAQSVPSPFEVYSQVSFAIAFSHIVKQHTGINIKVPVTNWTSFSATLDNNK